MHGFTGSPPQGSQEEAQGQGRRPAEADAAFGALRSRRSSSRRSASPVGTRSPARADAPGGRGPGPAPSGRPRPPGARDQVTITGKDLDRTAGIANGSGDKAVAERGRAVDAAILAIEKQFGRGSIMKLGSAERQAVDFDPDGLDRAGPRARRRRHPARPDHRDLRPRVVGQDHGLPARHRGGPAQGRDRGVHRRRARARPGLCPRLRRERRRAPRQPARHRRAGARDHRDPDPLRRRGHRRRRLRRGPRAARRDRGRDGRQLRRHPGPADEPGAAQADGRRVALQHRARVHQPAAREDRRDVRQPRDHAGRPRAQVLRLGPARHPARRDDQDRHGVGRQPGPRQGRQEQGRRRRSASPSST